MDFKYFSFIPFFETKLTLKPTMFSNSSAKSMNLIPILSENSTRILQDIRNDLSIHKNRLFKDYPIKSMAIFGSYSRKEQKESRDLDLILR